MSDGNLFCGADEEYYDDDIEDVVSNFFNAGWAWDYEQPMHVQEWTAREARTFLNDDYVLEALAERICEVHLEEQMDEDGHTWTALEKAAKDPAIREKFTALLDDLFAGVRYRWADQMVATWEVRWDVPPDLGNDDVEIDMSTVTYARNPPLPS